MTQEEGYKILQAAVARVSEHFDSVNISGTWVEGNTTRFQSCGSGNFYARVGMAHQFIESARAEENAQQIAQRLNDDE